MSDDAARRALTPAGAMAPALPSTQDMQPHPKDEAVTFDDVVAAELGQIIDSRERRKVPGDKPASTEAIQNTLVGLAFSGGGIRSATLNLGILQALAANGLLHRFDYLSTVSGGGYTGSWLAALTHRLTRNDSPRAFAKVEAALKHTTYQIGKPAEPHFIRWLRNYSDYLTPRVGLLSGDTWAMVATWLRNVILNQIVLILFLLGLTFVPAVAVLLMRDVFLPSPYFALAVGLLFVLSATIIMAISMSDAVPWASHQETIWLWRNRVHLLVIPPFFCAAALMNGALWTWPKAADLPTQYWVLAGAVFYTVVWILAFVIFRLQSWSENREQQPSGEAAARPQNPASWPALVLSAAVAGPLGGLLLHWYAGYLLMIPYSDQNLWFVVILGTATVMCILLLVAILHLGFIGHDCLDLVREWWARAGGSLLLTTLIWMTVFAIVIFGPLGVRGIFTLHSGYKLNLSALLTWIVSSAGGIFASKSAKTSGDKKGEQTEKSESAGKLFDLLKIPAVLDIVARVSPYVFAAGLLVLLSTGAHILGGRYLASAFTRSQTEQLWDLRAPVTDVCSRYWAIQSGLCLAWVFVAALLFISVAYLVALRVDVNDFSMHHFYRNRLVRCYLGASNFDRRPQPFTGFDENDDLPLGALAGSYPGPYPIVNATLNVTRGEELGFQKRKAKSFVFTPQYCGYDLAGPPPESANKPQGNAASYIPSYLPPALGRSAKFASENKGISLGTAVAISGAAVSPNMGHYTAPATAFFMTLFDVRLGWWMGNPRKLDAWKSAGPGNGLAYLLYEMAARTNEQNSYVYLSDGGHFENLAIYELIKRRCRLIVACDCGADGGYGFGDLMSAIEKVRTDFGADVRIDVSPIKPEPGERLSRENYVIGRIHYGCDSDTPDYGTLIYIKASLPADNLQATPEERTPADVMSYAELHTDFPHQTTADQWFDETQFESYRALGEHLGNLAAKDVKDNVDAVL